jgi:5-methylcytosine-specific restriction endonuclease McrA
MKKHYLKNWAPKCALPDCNDPVSYHKKWIKQDGTVGVKWKTFCDNHRTVNKAARDIFMKSRGGCENRNGTLGLDWKCGDPDTDSLTIDHWDGNKHNNNQDNLIILCANCHNKKTKLFKDNTQRYQLVNPMFYNLFEEQDS